MFWLKIFALNSKNKKVKKKKTFNISVQKCHINLAAIQVGTLHVS